MSATLPPRPRSRAALGLTAAAARGSFELQVCRECGAVQYPPREACHRCLSVRLDWRPQTGAGDLIAETRLIHSHDDFFRERVPIRLGLVRLDCGPTAVVFVPSTIAAAPARVKVVPRLDKAGQGVLVAFAPEGPMTVSDPYLQEMSCEPRGRKVLVTDATTALGAALVAELVKAGAATVWAGHPRDPLAVTAKEVKPLQLDVTRDNSVRAAAALGAEVDIVINTAQALGEAQQEMETNYFGLLRLSQAFAPALRTGAVAWVNVLSVYALQGFPQLETFAASMAAAHSLSQGLRADLLERGVRVINVFPGIVAEAGAAGSLKAAKIAPGALARTIVKALQDGVEDVYPGDAAQEWFARWRENPKVLEREVSANWRRA
ncbi:MAG TPA: SDR family NAD(P)-dependent oxidoreductase [Steroidobacteraceae bacterium]|nr:SDR family NAD(P)-dependent oxidoreductase [Steroidobacteraceae bacterium]